MILKSLALSAFLSSLLWTESDIQKNTIDGNWDLYIMDKKDVHEVRATLNFDTDKMRLSGFDACNRIHGALIQHSDTNITAPVVSSTRMGCRDKKQAWVSRYLHVVLKEGFFAKKENRNNIDGISIKSSSHELFLKKSK